MTREMVNQQEFTKDVSLYGIAAAILQSEIRGKAAAALESFDAFPPEAWAEETASTLLKLSVRTRSEVTPGHPFDPDGTSAAVLESVRELTRIHKGLVEREAAASSTSASRIVAELAAFNYFALTVMGVFGKGPQPEALWNSQNTGTIDPRTRSKIEGLASARQSFGLSPRLAWNEIEKVRSGTWLDVEHTDSAGPG